MREEPFWRRYLRFTGPDIDADVADELNFHLEMRKRDFQAAGMTPEQAREAARARFGDVAAVQKWLGEHDRKRQRQRDKVEILDQLLQDMRYGLRKLGQQPGFTAAAVAVLALGIGATTAIFSAVDAILLRPLPFADDQRLVQVDNVDIPMRFGDFPEPPKGAPNITDLASLREVFSSYAAYAPGGLNLTGTREPIRVRIAMVTPSFFSTLGVHPALGRPFNASEGTAGGRPAAILSDRLWRRHFGKDREVLGKQIALNGRNYQITGVMPAGFAFPDQADLWLPMPIPMTFAHWEPFRQYVPSRVVARLAPGVTVEQAGQRMRALFAQYATAERPVNATAAELVQPLRGTLVGQRRTGLLILLGATALVLLVACANVANLLLSRAAARRHEIAMRAVLGATPRRVLQQLLVESLILALIGGALGIVLALLSLSTLETLIPPHLAGTTPLRVDGRILLFTSGLVLLTGIAFGLWPALGARHADTGEIIKTAGSGHSTAGGQAGLRRIFVVGELALALMLLVGAGVMLRSFQTLLATDTGIQPERVATLELNLPTASYATPGQRRQFIQEVLDRLQAIPQIEAAGFVNELPLRGEGGIRIQVSAEGNTNADGEPSAGAQDLRVTTGYFRSLGIPILRGRSLSATVDSLAPREVVINQELARQLWADEDPVGKRLMLGQSASLIVGVAANVRPRALDDDEVFPQMYKSLLASPYQNLALVARGRIPADALAGLLQQAVHSVAPNQAVYNVRTMEQVISDTIAPRRTNTLLISIFGLLALVLAAVGVYGVIAYDVARRTREIGIRIALGARPHEVLSQVMRGGVMLAAAGIAVGLAGAWMLTRLLANLVYGVSPRDPITFVVAPLVLLAIATFATLLPAHRATRIDPVTAMRAE